MSSSAGVASTDAAGGPPAASAPRSTLVTWIEGIGELTDRCVQRTA